jgi:hypothetical protein
MRSLTFGVVAALCCCTFFAGDLAAPRSVRVKGSIGILKMTGHTSIAAACRHHARDATRTHSRTQPSMTKTDITRVIQRHPIW